MTVFCAVLISCSTAALMGASVAHGEQPSPLARLVFQPSLQAGVRDPSGKLIAGTEIMHLVPHKGRLYASTSLWMEKDTSIPKACQVLVLDSPQGQWRVELQFTTNNLRFGSLRQVTFTTDDRGRTLGPVSLLLAAPDVRSGPVEIFCRDDTTGEWSASVLGTVGSAATTRSIGQHRDRVTGIDRVFAGNRPLGVISGVYDAAAPGRIRWDKSAELQVPAGERVMGFCVCNGILYCATTRHIYQRTDGPAPKWKEVYFCKEEIPAVGIRGLTAVPNPAGKGEVLWFVALRKVRRLDPASGFRETVEQDMPAFLTEKLGVKVSGALCAYNELMPYVMPGTGETVWLFGFQCSHPAAVLNSHPHIKARAQRTERTKTGAPVAGGGRAGNGRYCIRRMSGNTIVYEVAEITDPRQPQLVATRTIAVSPFPEDRGRALYFGGYDCNSVPSHNTAWIYRGVLPHEADSAATLRKSAATLPNRSASVSSEILANRSAMVAPAK